MGKVCRSCPFRKDALAGLWQPAHYIGIAYLMSCEVPAQAGIMLCHKGNEVLSPNLEKSKRPVCAGWVKSAHTISMMMGMMRGEIDPKIREEKTPVMSPVEMLESNGIDSSMLPPIQWSREYWNKTRKTPDEWADEIDALKKELNEAPLLAWRFVKKDSPLHKKVDRKTVVERCGKAFADAYFPQE